MGVVMSNKTDHAEPRKLEPKQEQFCQEYIIDLNATQAYIRAGYAKKGAYTNAHRLIVKDHVSSRIAELVTVRNTATQVDQEWVISRLVQVAERCMQAEPVVDFRGKAVAGEYTFDAKGANGALNMLGKHTGIFAEDNMQRSAEVLTAIQSRKQTQAGINSRFKRLEKVPVYNDRN